MASRFIQITLFCLCFVSISSAYAAPDLFTIDNIKITETAESAATAKKKAIESGQVEAFSILAGILSLSTTPPDLSHINQEEVIKTVKSYEVQDEKIIKKKTYSATLQVSFNPEVVRSLLMRENIAFTEAINISPPRLIIPVFYRDEHVLLWSDDNLWRMAWENTGMQSRVVPFILPVGDLDDINIVSTENIVRKDSEAYIELAHKYGVNHVLLAEARYLINNTGTMPDLEIILTPINNPAISPQSIPVTRDETKSEYDFFEKAVRTAISKLEYDWKNNNSVQSIENINLNNFTAVIPITNASEWASIKAAIKNSPFIKNLEVKEFNNRRVVVYIEYNGKEEDLPLLFAEQNLDLSMDTNMWIITKLNQ